VPLFSSILKRGSGTGPAFTFLYAGPAISIISLAFTFKVIGPMLALWRLVAVFFISITIGLMMSFLFKGPAHAAVAELSTDADSAVEKPKKKKCLILFFLLLFLILSVGSTIGGIDSLKITDHYIAPKVTAVCILVICLCLLLARCFPKESVIAWLQETWILIRSIMPILIISVFLIGLLSTLIDIRWVHKLFSAQKDALGHRLFVPTLKSTLAAIVFGELMYFPILTEIVFVKAFLKLGIDIGPAFGLLLAGPGTSLPGLILIHKFAGFKKVLAYFLLSVILETVVAVALSMLIGDYLCACLIP
jgi:uncharacterized membrane protein YraQ (UPF0718 family)